MNLTNFFTQFAKHKALSAENQKLKEQLKRTVNNVNSSLAVQNASLLNQINGLNSIPNGILNVQTNSQAFGSMSTTASFQNLMNEFNKIKGMPYKFGGEGNGGIDCSAFTQRMMKAGGVNVPRTANEQFQSTKNCLVCNGFEPNKMRPGDLIFFKNTTSKTPSGLASHVGIYIGNGKMIHSGSSTKGVGVVDLTKGYNNGKWLGVTRPSNNFVMFNNNLLQPVQNLNMLGIQTSQMNFASMKPQQVYNTIKGIAHKLGDPHPEITAAQFCLESGYGKKTSGKFNYFGVKGKGSVVNTHEEIKGKLVSMKQSFRDYNSPIESIKDHINLKMTSRHYAGYSTSTNTDQALSCLKKYATNSNYLSQVKTLIKKYNNSNIMV